MCLILLQEAKSTIVLRFEGSDQLSVQRSRIGVRRNGPGPRLEVNRRID
jgi:hypothetical protein